MLYWIEQALFDLAHHLDRAGLWMYKRRVSERRRVPVTKVRARRQFGW